MQAPKPHVRHSRRHTLRSEMSVMSRQRSQGLELSLLAGSDVMCFVFYCVVFARFTCFRRASRSGIARRKLVPYDSITVAAPCVMDGHGLQGR